MQVIADKPDYHAHNPALLRDSALLIEISSHVEAVEPSETGTRGSSGRKTGVGKTRSPYQALYRLCLGEHLERIDLRKADSGDETTRLSRRDYLPAIGLAQAGIETYCGEGPAGWSQRDQVGCLAPLLEELVKFPNHIPPTSGRVD